MEENKKGTRKRIARRPAEGHAEKVDYSTSRSFDSQDRPARRFHEDRPAYGDRKPRYGEHRSSYGEHKPSYGEHKSPGGEHRGFKGGSGAPRKSGYGKPSFGPGRPAGPGRPGGQGLAAPGKTGSGMLITM